MSNLDNNADFDASIKDVFIDKGGAMQLDASPGIEEEVKVEAPKFKAPAKKTFEAQATADALKGDISPEKEQANIDARIAAMEKQIKNLKLAPDGVKVVQATAPKPINFATLEEASVYDLSVPIEAISHQVPDLTKVVLKDQNYVPRYISMHPGRLGPMKAAGFTYVTKEDIESLDMDIEPDENGQYVFIDVVIMKCLKSKYYGALRANFLKAQAATNPKMLHQVMKKQATDALGSMADPDAGGRTHKKDAQKYISENKLEVYI